jgi:hypothetical protein
MVYYHNHVFQYRRGLTSFVVQGSIFSSIGSGINAIISAIAGVIMTIVGAITTVCLILCHLLISIIDYRHFAGHCHDI